MNRDDKIRDLINRLAGMSPQPPPFPEDTPMAKSTAKSKPNPILMFAAGAAIVAAVLVPLLFLDGSGPLVAASSTTTTLVASSTSTTAVTSTTVPSTTSSTSGTTTTVPAPTPWNGTMFMYQTPQNSFLSNPALVPLTFEMTDLSGQLVPDAPFTEALALLGPQLPELPAGSELFNGIPPDVQIVDLSTGSVDGSGVWIADMNEAFLDGAGGLLADFTMLNQLIYTITAGDGTDAGVLFTVGGQPVTAFGSEGLDLSGPVDRDSFIDELALIFLTEPLYELEGSYLVIGLANVFEASLMVQVVDEAGEVVHEMPVTASCGTGCWGEFSAEIDATLITPGESSIRLLTYSPEDGSPIDVITVPIPAGDTWAVTVG